LGGLISFYFSSYISIADTARPARVIRLKLWTRIENYFKPVIDEKPFITFSIKRFVYLFGIAMGIPIFPIFFVRHLHASDSWISTFSTVQTSFMIIGYFFWSRQTQKHGSRIVLLWTTLGISLYPILTSFSNQIWPIALYAGMAGIFQAGLDLVFFDELLRTIPRQYSATFVSLAQSLQHFSSIAAPLIGSWISDSFSPGTALLVSGLIRLFAFFLFLIVKRNPPSPPI
jgi:predicted MFS family arabinose efflux permease